MMNLENLGAYTHDRVLVTQTFGRETGFLAGAARFADPGDKLPLLIMLPEDQKSEPDILNAIDTYLQN